MSGFKVGESQNKGYDMMEVGLPYLAKVSSDFFSRILTVWLIKSIGLVYHPGYCTRYLIPQKTRSHKQWRGGYLQDHQKAERLNKCWSYSNFH